MIWGKVMGYRIQQIESYVKQSMETVTAPDLRIAHNFKHVECRRKGDCYWFDVRHFR